jgi:hypothetical protein
MSSNTHNKIKLIEMEYSWKYSGRWPYNGMVNDLWRGVQSGQNYLVALGLFAWSEALGRNILGTVGDRTQGTGLVAYKEFTEKYVEYSFTGPEWEEIFTKFRHGLSHEFYIKKFGSSVFNDDGKALCGINISRTPYELRIHSYFLHFVRGLERALDAGVLP